MLIPVSGPVRAGKTTLCLRLAERARARLIPVLARPRAQATVAVVRDLLLDDMVERLPEWEPVESQTAPRRHWPRTAPAEG